MMLSSSARPDPLALITSIPSKHPSGQLPRSSHCNLAASGSVAQLNSAVQKACRHLSAPQTTSEPSSKIPGASSASATPFSLRDPNSHRSSAVCPSVRDLRGSPPTSTKSPSLPRSRRLGNPKTPTKNLVLRTASPTTSPSHRAKTATASLVKDKERICLKVPQKLPVARLVPNSSPYEDLTGHLSRHNLLEEARQAHETRMPPEYMLNAYLTLGQQEDRSLYHQAQSFLGSNQEFFQKHIRPGDPTPATVRLGVAETASGSLLPPTHLFTVHSTEEAATVYAAHGLVLALQCVSIPFLPASETKDFEGTLIRDLPIVPLRVPQPKQFGVVMRYLYSLSPSSLLEDLLPLPHIVRYLAMRARERGKKPEPLPSLEIASNEIVEAMSFLPTKVLLDLLQRVQAVWKNGVAIGIASSNFWNQLDRAWSFLVHAMLMADQRRKLRSSNDLTLQLQLTTLEDTTN